MCRVQTYIKTNLTGQGSFSQNESSNEDTFNIFEISKSKQRKAILSTLTKEQLEVLPEVALNIYKGVFTNKHK